MQKVAISVSNTYKVSSAETEPFFARRSKSPTGMPPRFSVPQPFGSLVARLVYGTYAMNQIQTDGKRDVVFTAPGGHKFVEWILGQGERVYISHRHLLGFTAGVRLRTVLTLQVSAMAIGHILYQLAEGPGKIVFETCGEPGVFDGGDCQTTFPMNRLIAWAQGSEFGLEGFHSAKNIIFDSLHLQPLKSSGLVLDADSNILGRHSNPLVALAKKVYLPG